MMSALSPTQVKALGFARDHHEGRLFRWPGGYWCDDPWERGMQGPPRRWVGTHTVEALRVRGMVSRVEGARLRRGDYSMVEITSQGIAAHKSAVTSDKGLTPPER